MKNYIEHMRQRPPHERRIVAMRIAGAITGVLLLGWLVTLPTRLTPIAQKSSSESAFETQLASVFSAFTSHSSETNTLEVASSTNR